MSWTKPHPVLARKRPTASLISRKVLTPLIGQIVLCFLIQLLSLKSAQAQPWSVASSSTVVGRQVNYNSRFIPPKVDLERPNIQNSENTTLFLVSCYESILSSVIISVGRPFRQPMFTNGSYDHTTFICKSTNGNSPFHFHYCSGPNTININARKPPPVVDTPNGTNIYAISF